jgi:hypothetical protein
MTPTDLSEFVPPRPRPERPSHGCPECFGALRYNGRGYHCIACAYTCPLLGYPAFSAKSRKRLPVPRTRRADHS